MTEDELWNLLAKQKAAVGAEQSDEGTVIMHDESSIWFAAEKKGAKVALQLPPQMAAEMAVSILRLIGHLECGCNGNEQHNPPKRMGGPFTGGSMN